MKFEIDLSDMTISNLVKLKERIERRYEKQITLDEMVLRCFFAGAATIEVEANYLEKYHRLTSEKTEDEKKKARTDR